MKRFTHQLYILQLENYNLQRYIRLIPRLLFSFAPKERRQSLVWTAKLKALTLLALLLIIYVAGGGACEATCGTVPAPLYAKMLVLSFLANLVVFLFFFPLFLVLAALILGVPEFFVKRHIADRAAKRIRSFKKLKVVGIAGSYGKTTMKEMIAGALSEKYKVVKTPETVNTPLGIARLVERELNENTDVFVVEMGEHVPGDVRDICRVVKPGVGVITGINEAHLERMGSIEATVATVFELAESGPEHLVLNVDSPLVFKNYEKFIDRKFVSFYSAEGNPPCDIFARNIEFRADGSGQSFELEKGGKFIGKFTTPILGGYVVGTVIAALLVGEAFGLAPEDVVRGVAKVRSPKHRLELVPTTNGVVVIDDGYNGNPDGARAAIEVLKKFKTLRKVYVTPGLVEMGPASAAVHEEIGKELAAGVDLVVLIKNSVTQYIVKGLEAGGFKKENILTFESAQKAHAEIGNIVKKGDVVLFQNDWPENYV